MFYSFWQRSQLVFLLLVISQLALAESAIIPQPKNAHWGTDSWSIPKESEICFSSGAESSVRWLQKLIAPLTNGVSTEGLACKKASWVLQLDSALKSLGEEGYRLSVSGKGVVLSSSTNTGLFYAIQTLRQLLPAELELSQPFKNGVLPYVEIEDAPLYSWRGSMLDVARSFYSVAYVKQHIDRMALFKLNRLHLHLTDDQGWRIEIKAYPNLTRHGGAGAVTGGSAGFYTQEDYKEIQRYASDRKIIVIPEVDMPGHIYAALASQPELNCENFTNITVRKATPPQLYPGTEVKWNSLCIEKDEVKAFATTVLQELAAMTQGPWIHIGGDEAELVNYDKFVSSLAEKVYKFGKTPVGWQEILNANIKARTIGQIWTHDPVNSSNPQILSYCDRFYFDHSNTPAEALPNDWCKKGGVSLEDTYGFTFKGGPNNIGIEAAVWTEWANNTDQMDDRLWPRLAASAEVSWTSESRRDVVDFHSRLAPFGKRFDLMGIHFYETPTVQWIRAKRSMNANSVFLDR